MARSSAASRECAATLVQVVSGSLLALPKSEAPRVNAMTVMLGTKVNVIATPVPSDVAIARTTARGEHQSTDGQLTSQGWFDPADEVHVNRHRAVAAQRRTYEDQVNTLWRDVKSALAKQVAGYGDQNDAIQWGQTLTGSFAATRFRRPLALFDVALDSDSGLIACIYTFGSHDDAPYQESVRVLLVTEGDTMFLRTQEGRRLQTCDDAARDLLTPYLTRLTCDVAS